MRILITNDDGIHAEGIEVLERVALQFTSDVWVVAPQIDQSGVAHSLSLEIPLRLSQLDNKRFAVSGTPTDCVIMAVKKILGKKPDLVLSGINNDHNVSDGIIYSGTVAGAIEGTLLGIKSIAISQVMSASSDREPKFSVVEKILPALMNKLMDITLPNGTFFNINFPSQTYENIGSTELTAQGKKNWNGLHVDERFDHFGRPYYWLVFRNNDIKLDENSDVNAIQQGKISITPLQVNLTNFVTLQNLSKDLKLNFLSYKPQELNE